MGQKKKKAKDKLRKVMWRFRYCLGTGIILERVAAIQDLYIPASIQHKEVFPKYQGVHRGATIVITGTGPTFAHYKPIEGAVHIAVNNAIYREDIKYGYFFSSDYNWEGAEEFFDFIYEKRQDVIKFYLFSANPARENDIIPAKYREQENVESYYADSYDRNSRGSVFRHSAKFMFHPDISVTPIKSYGTTAHIAFQFALWTRPKKIVLVGMDCTVGHAKGIGYQDGQDSGSMDFVAEPWKKLKEFAANFYPDTEVVSLNPVGLKGVFKDEYSREYLKTKAI